MCESKSGFGFESGFKAFLAAFRFRFGSGFGFEVSGFGSGFGFEMSGFAHH